MSGNLRALRLFGGALGGRYRIDGGTARSGSDGALGLDGGTDGVGSRALGLLVRALGLDGRALRRALGIDGGTAIASDGALGLNDGALGLGGGALGGGAGRTHGRSTSVRWIGGAFGLDLRALGILTRAFRGLARTLGRQLWLVGRSALVRDDRANGRFVTGAMSRLPWTVRRLNRADGGIRSA